MKLANMHRFHTRHDFTPASALDLYEAIRSLSTVGNFVSESEIFDVLNVTGSPLARRRDLSKVLASLSELGLIQIGREGIFYVTEIGDGLLGKRLWRRRFVSMVHGLYALGHKGGVADPRWSYREVCRILTDHAPRSLSPDDMVMEVAQRARARFGTEKVSFSRSSVGGVKAWLDALDPPVLCERSDRGLSVSDAPRSPTLIGDILETALFLAGGHLRLEGDTLSDLGSAMLLPRQTALHEIKQFVEPETGLVWLDEAPPRLWRITTGDRHGC